MTDKEHSVCPLFLVYYGFKTNVFGSIQSVQFVSLCWGHEGSERRFGGEATGAVSSTLTSLRRKEKCWSSQSLSDLWMIWSLSRQSRREWHESANHCGAFWEVKACQPQGIWFLSWHADVWAKSNAFAISLAVRDQKCLGLRRFWMCSPPPMNLFIEFILWMNYLAF